MRGGIKRESYIGEWVHGRVESFSTGVKSEWFGVIWHRNSRSLVEV